MYVSVSLYPGGRTGGRDLQGLWMSFGIKDRNINHMLTHTVQLTLSNTRSHAATSAQFTFPSQCCMLTLPRRLLAEESLLITSVWASVCEWVCVRESETERLSGLGGESTKGGQLDSSKRQDKRQSLLNKHALLPSMLCGTLSCGACWALVYWLWFKWIVKYKSQNKNEQSSCAINYSHCRLETAATSCCFIFSIPGYWTSGWAVVLIHYISFDQTQSYVCGMWTQKTLQSFQKLNAHIALYIDSSFLPWALG